MLSPPQRHDVRLRDQHLVGNHPAERHDQQDVRIAAENRFDLRKLVPPLVRTLGFVETVYNEHDALTRASSGRVKRLEQLINRRRRQARHTCSELVERRAVLEDRDPE